MVYGWTEDVVFIIYVKKDIPVNFLKRISVEHESFSVLRVIVFLFVFDVYHVSHLFGLLFDF